MLQSSGPRVTLVKPLSVSWKKGNYFIYEDMALLLSSYWFFLREFNRKSTVATLLLHSADPGEGSIMLIHWTRKFTKSDSYLRIILHIWRTEAMRLHSSLSKSLGQDRYLDDIIHTLTARWGASLSQREIEGRMERKLLGKERDRERDVYGLRLFLP